MMRCYQLAAVCLLLGVLEYVGADTSPKISCYDCTYYRSATKTETNPNCRKPDSSAAVINDCTWCTKRIYANDSRVFIQRSCARICTDKKKVRVTHQDLVNVMATEHCCSRDWCNIGGGASTAHEVARLVLITAALFVGAVWL